MSGESALAQQVGLSSFQADWKSGQHRMRRLIWEFIGVFGLTFVVSGTAATIAKYG